MIRFPEQRLSPEAQSFQRLPAYVRADIINRANSMGVDYIALFQAEQRQALDKTLAPDLSSQRNFESCTENAQNADHMPFSEGADEMLKRQKLTINGQQRWVSFNSTQDLVNLIEKECAKVENTASPIVVSDYMTNWFETYKVAHLDPNTASGTLSIIKNHILPFIGSKNLNDVSVADVQAILSNLKSASMAKKTRSVIRQCFDAAIADELYKHPNPTEDKRIVMSDKVEKRKPLTKDEMSIVMNSLNELDPEQAKLLVLLIMTACRRSEALGVHWEDIDWEKNTIHLQHAVRFRGNQPELSTKMKTDAANRTVSLWPSLIPYLGTPQSNGLIIHSGGKPISETQYKHRWKAIQKKLKAAGLEKPFTAHQLRHTFATIAANSGEIPLKVLQGILGHSNFQTTMNTYASFDANQMITKSSIISEKYAQLTSKSCNENCSGESA